MWPRAQALGKGPSPRLRHPSPARAGEGTGERGSVHVPTAFAVGQMMSPAPRAELINTSLAQDNSSLLLREGNHPGHFHPWCAADCGGSRIFSSGSETRGLTVEMLKMKIDPTMCMKTQDRMTKCTPIGTAFYTKMQQFWDNRQQSAGLLAENANHAPFPARLRVSRDENDFGSISRFDVHELLSAVCPSRRAPDSSRGEERWTLRIAGR